jgi:hypothetical protein
MVIFTPMFFVTSFFIIYFIVLYFANTIDPNDHDELPMPPQQIKLVLFDMDRTFLSIHTSGVSKNVDDVVQYVSPCFKKVVPQLIDNGFKVGIVTFADDRVTDNRDGVAGHALVRAILDRLFPDYSYQIPIVAFNPNIENRIAKSKSSKQPLLPINKNSHIEKIKREWDTPIEDYEIILFDDSYDNIRDAKCQTYHVTGDRGLTYFHWFDMFSNIAFRNMT